MASTGQPLQAIIDACLTRLHDVEHASKPDQVVTLSHSCPELSLQLDNSQLDQLEPALEDLTTLGQLRDASASLSSLQSHAARTHAPSVKGLKQLLDKVYTPEKKAKPLVNPVDKLLQDNWLSRNLHLNKKPSEKVILGITNIIVLLLVVLVLFIIVNELRAANVFKLFGRRSGKRRRPRDRGSRPETGTAIGIQEIGELPLKHQVPALLRHALHYLIDQQVLPRRYNLTNQEFLDILRQQLPAASRDFAQLVDSGERVVYGNKTISPEETRHLYEYVRNIEQTPSRSGT